MAEMNDPQKSGQVNGLEEAFQALMEYVPKKNKRDFILVGGANLKSYGSKRETMDLDFAIPKNGAQALVNTIYASGDVRFSFSGGQCEYTCQGSNCQDITIPIEFIELGEGHIERIDRVEAHLNGYRASIGDMIRLKAYTYLEGRKEPKDKRDFNTACKIMKEMNSSFAGISISPKDLEIMRYMAENTGPVAYEVILEHFPLTVLQ